MSFLRGMLQDLSFPPAPAAGKALDSFRRRGLIPSLLARCSPGGDTFSGQKKGGTQAPPGVGPMREMDGSLRRLFASSGPGGTEVRFVFALALAAVPSWACGCA